MATGGFTVEHQSPKRLAVESLFERLVKETESEVRDTTQKMYERSVITGQQKEDVIKILSKHHLKTDYAASVLFEKVLINIKDDDRHFDRLLLALRDLELDNLAEKLKESARQSTAPPRSAMNAPEHAMGMDIGHDDVPTDTLPDKMVEEELSDSGIGQQSTSTHHPLPEDVPYEHAVLVSSSPYHSLTSLSPQYDNQVEEYHHELNFESEQSPHVHIHDADSSISDVDNHSPDLPSQPQITEPQDQDNSYDAAESTQARDNHSTSMLLVAQGGYTAPPAMSDIGGSSDELVDQVTKQLTEMRLELQSKERELQARSQEMKENSDLLARCRELEEHVNRMENEVKEQKRRTDKISSDKDVEINRWKKQCEENGREIEMLRGAIARKEQEKRNLAVAHKTEIKKLHQRQNKSTREMLEYKNKVAALDSALREATSKKEAAEKQLKEADSKIQMAENEQLTAVNKLLENMCAKERELSQIKEEKLKLEIEIQKLECKNQSLVVLTKDQEVRLHQKDKELAQHKQAVAEEKHKQERRQSQQLQEENTTLKRQLSELQERMSAKESLAKRSKTN